MATDNERLTHRDPGPWSFHTHRYGFANVVLDGNGGFMACSVPVGSGPLMAAAPELLQALQLVAVLAPVGSQVHQVAASVIERVEEREAIQLAEWRPHQPAPPFRESLWLRVVGVAT